MKFNATRRDLLLGFYENICHLGDIRDQKSKSSSCGSPTNLRCEVDIHDNDPKPMEIVEKYVYGEDSSWFSQKRMIINVFEEFSPECNDSSQTNKKLYELLDTYRDSTQIDDPIFLGLTSCMQKWCMYNDIANASHDIVDTSTAMLDSTNNESSRKYVIMLTRWAIESSARLKNPNSNALLATILLSSSKKGFLCDDNDNETSTTNHLQRYGKQFDKWYPPLAAIIRRGSVNCEDTTDINMSDDILLQATMKNLHNHQVKRLLSNVLDLTNSSELILLINHVLRQPQNADLKLAVSLLTRGDSLSDKHQHHEDQTFSSKNSIDNKSNWNDDEDSEIEEESGQKPSSHKKARGGSMHYRQQELLTMVKLDRYYNERIQQAFENQKHKFDSLTIEVATKIVKAPWKEWGLYVLVGTKTPKINGDNRIDKVDVDSYVETLGYLLQASSSMRSVAKFTPLSPLAFNPIILSALWNLIQNGQSGFILSIFSDLFSYYLLALGDEDFVKYHCNSDSSTKFEEKIEAKDLVARYGKELHELYWMKPVICSEIQMDSIRGRLILSGTKLWNSLYERWNRLVNVTFCEENAWWFPHMGCNDGTVIPGREIGHGATEQDDDDSDSMDVDGYQNQLSMAEEASDALADSFRDPKMARVLTSIPQAFPFDRRVRLFHSLLKADKQKVLQAGSNRRALMALRGQRDGEDEMMMWLDGSIREQVKIKRASLYNDSMETLNKLGAKLKHQSKFERGDVLFNYG